MPSEIFPFGGWCRAREREPRRPRRPRGASGCASAFRRVRCLVIDAQTRRRAASSPSPHRRPRSTEGVFRDSWPEIWLTSPPSSPLPLVHSAGKAVSSNAYATGTDQNCGNVITDRPSTRLHAPPGGHSSFSFGRGDDAPVEPRGAGLSRQAAQDAASGAHSNVASQVFGVPSVANSGSSNAFANGADQNCGNFITDRPTTRLHAPPGGEIPDLLRRRRSARAYSQPPGHRRRRGEGTRIRRERHLRRRAPRPRVAPSPRFSWLSPRLPLSWRRRSARFAP